MVEVRIVEKEAFRVCGSRTWISGQNNEEFAAFWSQAHQSGLVDRLRSMTQADIMENALLGISRVENDPSDRAFFFYIACESQQQCEELESFTVPAAQWAVFSNRGDSTAAALIEAELYCHFTWLAQSGYVHANAPEMEVYPADDPTLVEYWLPIVRG